MKKERQSTKIMESKKRKWEKKLYQKKSVNYRKGWKRCRGRANRIPPHLSQPFEQESQQGPESPPSPSLTPTHPWPHLLPTCAFRCQGGICFLSFPLRPFFIPLSSLRKGEPKSHLLIVSSIFPPPPLTPPSSSFPYPSPRVNFMQERDVIFNSCLHYIFRSSTFFFTILLVHCILRVSAHFCIMLFNNTKISLLSLCIFSWGRYAVSFNNVILLLLFIFPLSSHTSKTSMTSVTLSYVIHVYFLLVSSWL